MNRWREILLSLSAGLCLLMPGRADAHPHVWVTVKSEIIYAADGSMTGVRHAWTFDDMFSTFATQGLESKKKGEFSREELAPLAEVNVSSLKDFAYFTYAVVNGKKSPFADPVDYWLDFGKGALTLHFLLPLKAAAHTQSLELDIYDPTMFVDFSLAEKDPVALVGAPAQCKLMVSRPQDAGTAQGQMSESFFNSLNPSSAWGARFANKIAVKCP